MKNLLLSGIVLFTLLISNNLFAQTKTSGRPIIRCATMQRVERLLQHNPQLRTGANLRSGVTSPSGSILSAYRLNAVVTIPIVVHIVLPNPFLVLMPMCRRKLTG
ncbi:MAG TPA: hypothetical protein VEV15_00600 [Flavisolibacter sp.]|nr:hypothetical protein [Flavisolibacter sp.]